MEDIAGIFSTDQKMRKIGQKKRCTQHIRSKQNVAQLEDCVQRFQHVIQISIETISDLSNLEYNGIVALEMELNQFWFRYL